MYKIKYENEHVTYAYEFKDKKNIFKPNIYSNIKDIELSKVYDKFETGLNILKPIKEQEDYQIIYSNHIFWDYFKDNLHEEIKGCLLKELIYPIIGPIDINFKNLGEGFIKLYTDDELSKVWSLKTSEKNGLIYISVYDKTYYYHMSNNLGSFSDEKVYNKFHNQILDGLLNIEEISKTAYNIKNDEGFYWTDQINKMLEINSKNKVYFSKESLIFNYASQESINKIQNAWKQLTLNNSCTVEYEVKTAKGHVKYFRSFYKLVKNEDKIIRLGYTHDITNEYLSKKEALDLKENIDTIEDFSKIFIATYEDGEYNFTSGIYKILGIKPNDYQPNQIVKKFMVQEDYKKFRELFYNVTPDNPEFYFQYRAKTINNEIRYISAYTKSSFTDNGELIKIVAFEQDITEKTLAKIESLRLTENFEFIQDTSKIVICEYANGKYYFTDEAYNILGIKPDDYPDTVNIIEKFIIPEDKKLHDNSIDNLTSNNPETHVNYRVLNANGELKYLNVHSKALFNNNGELIRKVGFIQDITEETLAKQSALELQNSLNILGGFSKIVIGYYEDSKYSWTPEIYNILGINPKDYPDTVDLIAEFSTPEDNLSFNESMESLAPDNNTFSTIRTVHDSNGNLKYLNLKLVVDFDEKGNIKIIHKFLQDITENVNREHELEDLSEERKVLLQEIQDRIKNNLQLLSSYLSLDSRYYKDYPNYVILRTKKRLDTMAATYEEIYNSPDLTKINLENLLINVINGLYGKYNVSSIKNLKIHYDIDSNITVNMKESLSLSYIIASFADNTFQHAFPEGSEGNFYLQIRQIDDNLIIKIWDDGMGLPDNVDLNSPATLGLMIINNLISQLEGKLIQVYDVPGFGVELTIPILNNNPEFKSIK